jgi:hypothetical protein
MKKCPKCQSLMPNDVTLCIRCGFDSVRANVAAPGATRPAQPPARPASTAAPLQAKGGRIRNGLTLAKQSFRVLMLDKALLVFPLLSGIACFLVLVGFVAGALAGGFGAREAAPNGAAAWLVLFAYYFANYFVIVFFNSALVACATIRFRGGVPTVGAGLGAARANLGRIAAWALLAATVGVLLRIIEERVQLVGRIVIALVGATWTLAAYFVVPALVVEQLGPIDALKRSSLILKKAWGESIVSNASVGLITFLVTLLLVLATGAATVALSIKFASIAVAVAGLALIALLVVLSSLVGSALSSIMLSALYLYATEGKLPEAFAGTDLQGAFAAR